MAKMPQGQTSIGTQTSKASADQSTKRGGRSDGTDALAGPSGRMANGYPPAAKSPARNPGGREIDPAVVRRGWVNPRGTVATSPVDDATVGPDGTRRIVVSGGSSGSIDEPG